MSISNGINHYKTYINYVNIQSNCHIMFEPPMGKCLARGRVPSASLIVAEEHESSPLLAFRRGSKMWYTYKL